MVAERVVAVAAKACKRAVRKTLGERMAMGRPGMGMSSAAEQARTDCEWDETKGGTGPGRVSMDLSEARFSAGRCHELPAAHTTTYTQRSRLDILHQECTTCTIRGPVDEKRLADVRNSVCIMARLPLYWNCLRRPLDGPLTMYSL